MNPARSLRRGISFMTIAGAILAISHSRPAAQIPDKFTNLQILPKEITRRDLVQRMRWFAGALGVRCNHCHVGKDAATLEGFDFASDEKATKKAARAMMRMVQEINDRLVPAAGLEHPHAVSCITCHRGATKPLTLYETLSETARKDGLEAALKQYRDLREEHYGDGLYDFSPRTLNTLAETLAREQSDLEGALLVARLNAEFYPREANVHVQIGQLCLQKQDKECALAELSKAAELAPDDAWVRKQLEALKGPPKE